VSNAPPVARIDGISIELGSNPGRTRTEWLTIAKQLR